MNSVVEILAATIPDAIDLENEKAVAEYLVATAPIAGYSLAELSRNFYAIIERAREMQQERANA